MLDALTGDYMVISILFDLKFMTYVNCSYEGRVRFTVDVQLLLDFQLLLDHNNYMEYLKDTVSLLGILLQSLFLKQAKL